MTHFLVERSFVGYERLKYDLEEGEILKDLIVGCRSSSVRIVRNDRSALLTTINLDFGWCYNSSTVSCFCSVIIESWSNISFNF